MAKQTFPRLAVAVLWDRGGIPRPLSKSLHPRNFSRTLYSRETLLQFGMLAYHHTITLVRDATAIMTRLIDLRGSVAIDVWIVVSKILDAQACECQAPAATTKPTYTKGLLETSVCLFYRKRARRTKNLRKSTT